LLEKPVGIRNRYKRAILGMTMIYKKILVCLLQEGERQKKSMLSLITFLIREKNRSIQNE